MKSLTLPALLAALLAACGGDSRPPVAGNPPPPVVPPVVAPPAEPPAPPTVPPPAAEPPVPYDPMAAVQFASKCQAPRTSAGVSYPDRQGTLADEFSFLRLWLEGEYLWYRELPKLDAASYGTAIDYFNALKTPQLTASGKPKDRYHFTYPSAQYEELSRGVELGYGVNWARNAAPNVPRTWRVTSVVPGSPAGQAGLRRGDRLLTVDGQDFVNAADAATVALLNAGLFPAKAGESHSLTLARGAQTLAVSLQASLLDVPPVQNTRVLETPEGKVGYLTFNNHNAVSELQLISAFTELKQAGVQDLVLDMRYNGGGLLVVASELAYMIAGPGPTEGKTFEHTLTNDKLPKLTALGFLARSLGLAAPKPAPARQPLPYLGLKRVTLLTGPGTCSASESLINGLRGVDVEVNLIGEQTCGKPYAFYPTPNCGTTYFAIQLQGVNEKGFGDYSDGFAPTCKAADDFSRAQGDPAEGQLAAALHYRATGMCPAPAAGARTLAGGAQPQPSPQLLPVRAPVNEISIYTRP